MSSKFWSFKSAFNWTNRLKELEPHWMNLLSIDVRWTRNFRNSKLFSFISYPDFWVIRAFFVSLNSSSEKFYLLMSMFKIFFRTQFKSCKSSKDGGTKLIRRKCFSINYCEVLFEKKLIQSVHFSFFKSIIKLFSYCESKLFWEAKIPEKLIFC